MSFTQIDNGYQLKNEPPHDLTRQTIQHSQSWQIQTYLKIRQIVPKIARPFIEQWIYGIQKNSFSSYWSLGNDCLAASILKEIGLRQCSGPFDWIAGLSYLDKLELINNNFARFLNKDDLEYQDRKSLEGTIYVRNLYSNALFIHDFKDKSIDDFNKVANKYHRRQSRFLSLIKETNILFLYIENTENNFDYIKNIDSVIDFTQKVSDKIGVNHISVILCTRHSHTNNFCEIYTKNNCSIFIQQFDRTIFKPGDWTPYSELNDLIKKALAIASKQQNVMPKTENLGCKFRKSSSPNSFVKIND